MKNLPANAGDVGSIPELGRSPGEGNGNSLLYSCLGNRMDRGAQWATVQRFTVNWTRLSRHTHRALYCLQSPSKAHPTGVSGRARFLIFLLFSKLSVLWWEKTQFCPRDQWLDSQFLLTTLHSWASVSPFTVLSLSKDKNRFYRMTNTIIIEEIFLPPQNIVVLDFNCLI